MSDTPSWLNEQSSPAPVAPPTSSGTNAPSSFSLDEGQAQVNQAQMLEASRSGGADPEAEAAAAQQAADEKDLPYVVLMMRLANMGVSVTLMILSIVTMATVPGSASTWVLAIYAFCFGLLVCCLETQLKFLRVMIAMNFGFLFSAVWRFFYYLLMGSVAWGFDNLFGKIVACLLGAVAIFNTYVLIRYPSYRKIREKIAEEEDKRIEAKISREVKKQAVSQLRK